jgi:hypothetical protein
MDITPVILEASPGPPESPHPRLTAAFGALDAAGVRWCLLRGERKLHAPSGDIDLLLARSDLDRVRRIVAEQGFTHIPAWGFGSHESYLAYDEPTDDWIKLDFVTELAFGPGFSLYTGAEEECLSRRVRRGPAMVLADEDAFWCLLLHAILDKGKVREAEAAELTRLAGAPCDASPLARALAAVAPAQWPVERFVAAAREGRSAELAAAGPALAARWARRRPADVWRRRVSSEAWRWAGRVLRLRRRRGVAVTLLGSGRDVTVAGLQRSFYFPVRVVAADATAAGRIRYHRARGRLVVVEGESAASDVTAVVDTNGDAERARREITATIWQAYATAWNRAGPR